MNIQESRQLAIDENTAPNILRQLADSTDLITRKNIVINPNIPPDVLSKLAVEFPKEVFDNPAIDLLLLETPDLFSGTLANIFCSLLKRELPKRMIEYAINSTDERLKLAILMNPKAAHETLKELAKDRNYQVQEATELHINSINKNSTNNYQEFIQAKIQQEILKVDQSYQEVIGDINQIIKLDKYLSRFVKPKKSYPQVLLSEVEKLISQKKSVFDIAANPNLTIDLIRKLLAIPDYQSSIAQRIGLNPSTPVEILEELAQSNHHNKVHEAIALNKNTPVYILEIILNNLRNRCNYVYEALGRNKKLSDRHFRQLVNESFEARIPVFNNPSSSKNLKGKLIKAFKKGIYSRTHKQFINDTFIIPISKYYSYEFIDNLFIPEDFLELCIDEAIINYKYYDSKKWTRPLSNLQTLALHPNINSNSLKKLLNHENTAVRTSALSNYKTPQYITKVGGMSFLESLNRDELKILAKSFYVTEELLRELVNHKDIVVSRTAASNPCASNEILEEWETSPYYKEGSLSQIMAEEQTLLDKWESSISTSNRLTVLLNSETPVSVLAKISLSTSWLERYAITQNPKAPYPIIQRLTNDGNCIVRTAAQASLKKYMKQIIERRYEL